MDTEAVVVAHRAGQGRYAGQLGALEVRAPYGRRFLIGTGFSDAQRRDPPSIGSVVTYRYRAWVHDRVAAEESIQNAWEDFAHPCLVRLGEVTRAKE